jgi:hypothetical protein
MGVISDSEGSTVTEKMHAVLYFNFCKEPICFIIIRIQICYSFVKAQPMFKIKTSAC